MNTTINEQRDDLAVTTAYIFGYFQDATMFFDNIDKAIAIARAFIEKYPTGYDWDKHQRNDGLPWSEELYVFYEEYKDKIDLCWTCGKVKTIDQFATTGGRKNLCFDCEK